MDDAINIGMTFYGGVSLAVYEAGVAEEFIRFVQYCKQKAIPVNVKVLSGSSAGGLASVMMSATLVNSSDPTRHLEEMRRLWFDIADLGQLQYKSKGNVISFLDNDILEDKIKDFLQIKDGSGGISDEINVLITGTNMQGFFDAVPVEDDFVNPTDFADRAFPTTRHTEVFKFDQRKIKKASETQGRDERSRIAKAARVTSSFPAAFPPQFTESPSFDESRKLYPDPNKVPLSFWYYDGGVLDNKPLGHAVDHMESSSVDGKWWFFFVDPDPESDGIKHQEWGADPRNPPDPATTAASVLEMRGAESIYHDLRQIQRINHQVEQITNLSANLWSTLCDLGKCSKQAQDILFDRLEQSSKTARIHRFLPDYLKCTAMVRSRFYAKLDELQKAELNALQLDIIDSIRPFDLEGIIVECQIQIKKGRVFAEKSRAEKDLLIKKGSQTLVTKEMNHYKEAVKDADTAQQQFRQIAFWVEDDFRGENQELASETWQTFSSTGKRLRAAIENLKSAYDGAEEVIKTNINDNAVFESMKCYIRLSEAIHSAAAVETRETINVVKIYHNREKGVLAGSKLGHFSGFLDRRWRKNDYLMGMLDAREVLQNKLAPSIGRDFVWGDYCTLRKSQEDNFPEGYRLTLTNDSLSKTDMELGNLPAAEIISNVNSVLSTFEKLIGKYKAAGFFKIAHNLRMGIFSKTARFFLWIVKQATAQPSTGAKKDAKKMSSYWTGFKHYVGFTFIGVLIGLVLSFFLPDILHDFANFLWTNAKALFR